MTRWMFVVASCASIVLGTNIVDSGTLPWENCPYRLWSLEELRFYASRFVKAMALVAKLHTHAICQMGPLDQAIRKAAEKILADLCNQLNELGLLDQASRAERLARSLREEGKMPDKKSLADLQLLIHHDMERFVFEAVPSGKAKYYQKPLDEWESVTARFPCAFDIEEASKCFALGRFTSCVFHLMRVTEYAVLELQCFLGKPDPKAGFGSVLLRLETLHRKTNFQDLPDHLKPFRGFLIEILPQLYAVKDSWRNKVCHVDGKIVPLDLFTEEMASGVYAATLLLMKKLAAGWLR